MKKMIMTVAIAISTIAGFATETVNPQVLKSFNTSFNTAKEVKWIVTENYFEATFTYNDQHLYAFYNVDGELTALMRYISATDLSLTLQSELKKDYKDYWIADLFEVAKNGETNYYITLENADTKLVLKSEGNYWNVFKKMKKS
jgi:hypothetical protein